MTRRLPEATALNGAVERFIRRMPKVELHLHLEGSIQPATLLDLAQRHGIDPPTPDVEALQRWYRFRDFPHFIQVWLTVLNTLRKPADFTRITRELGEAARVQEVRYLQVTFTPSTHLRGRGLTFDEVWGGIREGADWVERELGVMMQFAPDVPRNHRPGADAWVEQTAEWAVAHRDEGVVALGLGGDEAAHPIRHLLAAGVPVTVNSDDPPMFNTTLTDELLALARFQGFTPNELANLTRAAVEVSFLGESEKAVLRARVDGELIDAAKAEGVELMSSRPTPQQVE